MLHKPPQAIRVPSGFHQGSIRVPSGFHQGSIRVPDLCRLYSAAVIAHCRCNAVCNHICTLQNVVGCIAVCSRRCGASSRESWHSRCVKRLSRLPITSVPAATMTVCMYLLVQLGCERRKQHWRYRLSGSYDTVYRGLYNIAMLAHSTILFNAYYNSVVESDVIQKAGQYLP